MFLMNSAPSPTTLLFGVQAIRPTTYIETLETSLRFILAVMFFLAASLCFAENPSALPPSQRDVKIIPSEKKLPNYDSLLYFGLWNLDDRWQVVGHYYCPVDKVFNFWPVPTGCKGFISLYDGTLNHNDSIIDAWARSDNEGLRVDGKVVNRLEVFNVLHERNKEVVELDSQYYQLQGLSERSKTGYSAAIDGAHQELLKERAIAIAIALAALAAFICATFIIRWIFRKVMKIPAASKRLFVNSENAVKRVLAESEKNKVRRVVMDEVIRETTRSALADISDAEKSALRNQIKAALDSGNHEIAKSPRAGSGLAFCLRVRKTEKNGARPRNIQNILEWPGA